MHLQAHGSSNISGLHHISMWCTSIGKTITRDKVKNSWIQGRRLKLPLLFLSRAGTWPLFWQVKVSKERSHQKDKALVTLAQKHFMASPEWVCRDHVTTSIVFVTAKLYRRCDPLPPNTGLETNTRAREPFTSRLDMCSSSTHSALVFLDYIYTAVKILQAVLSLKYPLYHSCVQDNTDKCD